VNIAMDASAREIRIGLLWHSINSGNLGVGALTVANQAIARGVAEELGLRPRFVVMQPRDAGAPNMSLPDTETFAIDRRAITSPSGYWRTVRTLDCVLDIGAGDSFADIYGPRRFFFLWVTKLLAIARGVPLVLSPQTIGPFTKRAYRIPASFVMRHSEIVVARDEMSRDIAEEMAPNTDVALAADVAFVLPYRDRSELRGGPKLKIGINASGLLFYEAETGRNRFGLSYDYAEFTRALMKDLTARSDVELYLVPHATSRVDPTDDDGALADRLAAEFPRGIRVPNFPNPSEAKSFISGLDLLVAARMHACIGAFSSGTPVVPVAYSRKFTGLFGLLNYHHVLPVSGVDTASALAFVHEALARRDELAQEEARGMTTVQQLLDPYRDALRQVFIKAMERRG
jgi:colanic acid/amylovoran biosynthesis protein